jgi:hypothetical protein
VLGEFGKALLGADVEEIPASGRPIDLPAVFAYEIRDDLFVAERQYWGLLEFLVQTGFVGGPAGIGGAARPLPHPAARLSRNPPAHDGWRWGESSHLSGHGRKARRSPSLGRRQVAAAAAGRCPLRGGPFVVGCKPLSRGGNHEVRAVELRLAGIP